MAREKESSKAGDGGTIDDVFIGQRIQTLPYIDVALRWGQRASQLWIDVLEEGIRVETDIGTRKRRFPVDGPGTPVYCSVAEFLRAAESLVQLAHPFGLVVVRFVAELKREPSPKELDDGGVSHVIVSKRSLSNDINIVLRDIGDQGGIISVTSELGSPRVEGIGGVSQWITARDQFAEVAGILGDASKLGDEAKAFAELVEGILAPRDPGTISGCGGGDDSGSTIRRSP